MVCWCEAGDKEKTKSIADAEQHLADLTASIEELTANAARLTTEIANLEKEVAANGQALDTVQSISGLKAAIVAISKHHASALQTDAVKQIADMLGSHMGRYKMILAGVVTPTQKKTVSAFLQQKNNYAPQGGEIFGILTNMKESFEANLATAQKNEADAIAAYQELKAAKEEEIASGTAQIEAKTQEKADSEEKAAADKQDSIDTANTLAADQEYLAMLKETCANMDAQMEERTKTRNEEIQACSKALAVLSGDEAHDTFTRTFNAALFVQMSQKAERRTQAAKVLELAARKLSIPKLATLATAVKLDAFTAVVGTINKMINDLAREKQDEIEHRDWCIEEFSNTEKATELKTKDKDALTAKIEDLSATIASLAAAIDALNKEIADMQTQIKHAGEDRELENREYKQTVMDQRASQQLLTQALNILQGFYDKTAKGVALAQKQPAGPPPPPGFKNYDSGKGGGPIKMIQDIIAEAKALEAEAIRGEEEAQKSYEDMVRDTNKAIDEANLDLTNKVAAKGKAEGDKAEAEVELEANMSELELLANKSNDLHSSCDFMMKNFDIRQSRRDDEMEALKSAIGILKGAR